MSKKIKKGGQTMAQTAEKKREQEQDELQKQQDQVNPDETDLDETSQDNGNDKDEEEKTPLIQRIKIGALKVLKILIKWVLKPLAIAIVVFASMISLIVNLGGPGEKQEENGDTNTDSDPGDDDIPEEEFDDSDQDGDDQVE